MAMQALPSPCPLGMEPSSTGLTNFKSCPGHSSWVAASTEAARQISRCHNSGMGLSRRIYNILVTPSPCNLNSVNETATFARSRVWYPPTR